MLRGVPTEMCPSWFCKASHSLTDLYLILFPSPFSILTKLPCVRRKILRHAMVVALCSRARVVSSHSQLKSFWGWIETRLWAILFSFKIGAFLPKNARWIFALHRRNSFFHFWKKRSEKYCDTCVVFVVKLETIGFKYVYLVMIRTVHVIVP